MLKKPTFISSLALSIGLSICLAAAGLVGCSGGAGVHRPLALTILHINDHHSHLDADTTILNLHDSGGVARSVNVELGGFPRVAEAIHELSSAAATPVIVLHAGDAVTGDLYYTQSEGAASAAVMNTVCFDAFTVGNHEFDNGDAGLVKFIDFLHADKNVCDTPVLSANLHPAGEELKSRVSPYTVLRRDGESIGIIGITTSDAKATSRPDSGTTFDDETTSAQAAIDELEKKGIDKIILLTHDGYAVDMAMAPRLSGVDVIVGGHSHTLLGPASMSGFGLTPAGPYPTEAVDKQGKKVCISQAWEYSYDVGELRVSFDSHGDVTGCGGMPHLLLGDTYTVAGKPVGAADAAAFRAELDATGGLLRTTTPSPVTAAVLAPYKSAKDAFGLKVIGVADENLCLRRVPGTLRDTGRSTLGDICNKDAEVIAHGGDIQQLVAEAFLAEGRLYGGADIALENAGGVRIDIPAGDITIGEVYALLPFKQQLIRMTLSGAEVKAALEDGVDSVLHGTGTGAYPYTAGLRFDVDMNQPKGSRLGNLEFRQVDGSWTPLDLKATFRVITNDFSATGGDDYYSLAAVPADRRENTYLDYADSFRQYVVAHTPLAKLPSEMYSTQLYRETQ
jgi:5'-nucleotidase/UDP-sugar diphosphatase